MNADKDHEQSSVASLLLRDGYRFPWTEAMARSRWKPWLWWLLQLLRVVLVIIVLVLIGWGIKALVDRQEAMEAAEIIALTAVLVTAAGAAFTVAVNAWLGRKRLDHEERMQDERLEHARREATRTTAAEAYTKASEYLRIMNDDTVHDLAAAASWLPLSSGSTLFDECGQRLTFVEAMGWSNAVRIGALKLRFDLTRVRTAGLVAISAIKSTSEDEHEAMGSLAHVFEEAEGTLADFHEAIVN